MHTTKQIAIARAAGALTLAFAPTTERTPEQQSAYVKLLEAFSGNVTDAEACYTAAAKPDVAKRTRTTKRSDESTEAHKRANAETAAKAGNAAKPEPKAKPAKPAKPSKPADASKAAEAAERVKLIGELQSYVGKLYNDPSLAVRSNPKRIAPSIYSGLYDAPKHRTTLDRISTRDESALALIIQRGTKAGEFDPVALNLDCGIFSRMRSVGFIERCPASSKLPYRLTKPGAEHARKAHKRAA